MIELNGVSFSYGDRPVLTDVSASGTTLLITGPNGSGKTTLLKLILGLLAPTSGTVTSDRWSTRAAGSTLLSPTSGTVTERERTTKAAVFQDDRLIEHLSPIGNIRLAHPGTISNDRIKDELTAVGLPEETWLRPVRNLSGGQRRRVCLVRALLTGAELICLDEPFTGIDTESLPLLRRYVRAHIQGDLALVTHDEADLADLPGVRLRLKNLNTSATATREQL